MNNFKKSLFFGSTEPNEELSGHITIFESIISMITYHFKYTIYDATECRIAIHSGNKYLVGYLYYSYGLNTNVIK